uniref:Small ribosomal subunit protein uS15c n=1 Tax=Thuja occidentalis TaxID=3317 RepID=A0A499PUV3_THUOC|nr:ribosomal protein S15 [Thuja occidentalis]YP_010980806.1 ribosomal protein S15 [Thuja standishii]ATN40373.1 ribosomal protein S15 [Thuja occidentalis]WOC88566.1 ribosomal protein S15 [Thuja standishii]WOH22747.1 ribosomal protein S15 [Thuja standishii]WOH22829.1 ribosomal protein S15 [Thuja standishii]WOH22911.1 ribosomal protein S15 [Thuja standishii]
MIKNLSVRPSLIPREQRGSVESQVCYLTSRIQKITEHLDLHGRDYSSQRGLWKIVGKRKRLLIYLLKKDRLRYKRLIDQLDIRGLR